MKENENRPTLSRRLFVRGVLAGSIVLFGDGFKNIADATRKRWEQSDRAQKELAKDRITPLNEKELELLRIGVVEHEGPSGISEELVPKECLNPYQQWQADKALEKHKKFTKAHKNAVKEIRDKEGNYETQRAIGLGEMALSTAPGGWAIEKLYELSHNK